MMAEEKKITDGYKKNTQANPLLSFPSAREGAFLRFKKPTG
jgi:hypothetical protein